MKRALSNLSGKRGQKIVVYFFALYFGFFPILPVLSIGAPEVNVNTFTLNSGSSNDIPVQSITLTPTNSGQSQPITLLNNSGNSATSADLPPNTSLTLPGEQADSLVCEEGASCNLTIKANINAPTMPIGATISLPTTTAPIEIKTIDANSGVDSAVNAPESASLDQLNATTTKKQLALPANASEPVSNSQKDLFRQFLFYLKNDTEFKSLVQKIISGEADDALIDQLAEKMAGTAAKNTETPNQAPINQPVAEVIIDQRASSTEDLPSNQAIDSQNQNQATSLPSNQLDLLFQEAFKIGQGQNISNPAFQTDAATSESAQLDQIDESLFEVVDAVTDIADLGKGRKVMRIYANSRLVYKDQQTNEWKIRPAGWNTFDEESGSKLNATKGGGYQFSVDFNKNSRIRVETGEMEVTGSRRAITAPAAKSFNKKKNQYQTKSSFLETYSDVDVELVDDAQYREKTIIIKKKPVGAEDSESVVFWDKYILGTDNYVISDSQTKEIKNDKVIDGVLKIEIPGEGGFYVGQSLYHDGKGSGADYLDMNGKLARHLLKFDKKNNTIYVGVEIPTAYLLSADTVYPITIDPTWCKYTASNTLDPSAGDSCDLADFYFRTTNGGLPDFGTATDNTAYLFMGRDGSATRHPVIYFNSNFQSFFQGRTLDSAILKMKFVARGSGTSSYMDVAARRINWNWSAGSITSYNYSDFRNSVVNENPSTRLYMGTTNNGYHDINVQATVQAWIDGAMVRGVMVEQDPAWPSGSTPPSSWENAIFYYYARGSSSVEQSGGHSVNGPYLEIIFRSLPDLTVESSSIYPTSVQRGSSVAVTSTVKNIGIGNAIESWLGYYLSTDSACSSINDRFLDASLVGTLSVNQSRSVSKNVTIPSDVSANNYYFCFIIDPPDASTPLGSIIERNENNNTRAISLQVTNPVPVAPDLTFNGTPTVSPTSPVIGGQIRIDATVKNNGNAASNGTTVTYYLDGIDNGTQSVSSLSAGSSANVSKTFSIPTYTSTGSHNIQLTISTVIGETNTGNNSATINPSFVSGFDFSALNFSISDTSIHYSGNNDTVVVSGQIKNTGSVSASGVSYQMNLIKGSTRYALSSLSPSSLSVNSGETRSVSLTGYIPDGMPYYDNYQVEVILDTDGNFTESNESNNTVLTSNTVPVQQWTNGGGGGSGNADGDSQNQSEEAVPGTSDTVPNQTPTDEDANGINGREVDDPGADPVNIRTGSFELTQTDISLPGRGESIDFTRVYNSKLNASGRFGNGWTFSYRQYYFQDPTSKKVIIYQGGTVASIFDTADGGATFTAPPGEADKLYRDGSTLVFEKLNGVKYIYSNQLTANLGLLESIVDTNGNVTTLAYTSIREVDMLSAVSDSSGRAIAITYGNVDDAGRWDKIINLVYTAGDGERSEFVYTYDDSENLIQVDKTRVYNGATEHQVDTFTPNPSNRIAEHRDPRGTILYNTYDTEGRVTIQYEHNPEVDAPGAKRLIYTLEYSGADPAAPASAYCTLVKNYSDGSNFTSDKFCYNADHLKVYQIDKDGNSITQARNSEGLVVTQTDENTNVTTYEYDGQRRKTKEILPNTVKWRTEITYQYGPFNRVSRQQVSVTSLERPADPAIVKTTNYTIDPTDGNILSIQDPMGKTESYTYDSYGNVLAYRDKKNQLTSYTYDAAGNYRLSESKQVILPDDSIQTIIHTYEYDDLGRRTKYTTPRNFVYTYDYDNRGNLRQETNPLSQSKWYEYDIENHRTAMIDELNSRTNYIYGKDIGASLLREERVGATQTIATRRAYDNLGRVSSEFDAENNETRFEYDNAGRIYERTEPFQTVRYVYYDNGNIQQELIYPTGSVPTNWQKKSDYFYDKRNNLIETRQYLDNTNYVSISNEYDGFDRIVKTTDPNGNATDRYYDLNDRLEREVDARGNTTQYFYDDNGNKIGEKNPRCFSSGSFCNSDGYSTTYEYDEANRLIKTINADNKETIYYYNQDGQATRVIDRQNAGGSNSAHVTRFDYDALGRKTREYDGYNYYTQYGYDAVGNMATTTDQMGRVTAYRYDDFSRLTSEIDAGGNLTGYEYDKNGNRTAVVYPNTTRTEYVYDAMNRLTQIKDQLGNKRKFGYDTVGNKKYEVDKTNATTTFDYDRLNRLTGESNAAGTVTAYVYDANGNRTSETAAGIITLFEYDKLNRLATTTHPGGKTESFAYDAEGNVASKTDGKNQTITYQYDKLNRLTLKDLPAGADAVYAYDNWDNLLTLTDESGAATYTYDNNNRLTNEHKVLTGAGTYDIGRTYHYDGQLKTLTDATGRTVLYNYNSRGLLQRTDYSGVPLATYTYTSFGKPATLTYGNGIVSTYNYDGLERLTKLETKNSASETLFKQEYLYDGESNRTAMVENGVTTTYRYDDIHQLTGVDYPQFAGANNLDYDYNLSGNRTAYNTPYGQVAYSYTPNTNELSQATYDSRLNVNYTYDNNGSLTKETYNRLNKNIREVVYAWDAQNRLASIQYNRLDRPSYLPALSQNKIFFVYDDFGNRVKKNANGEVTYYLNDGLTVLNELDSSGNITKTMIRGLEPIAEIEGSGGSGIITYVHNDVLGSAVLLTDRSGAVKGKYEYEPFGDIVGMLAQGEGTDYLFTGQEYDIESSLYYYNARYYNPKLGRFISRDAFMGRDGDVLSRNRYIYVKNNPLKYVDPTGEQEEDINNDLTENLIARMKDAGRKMEEVGKIEWYEYFNPIALLTHYVYKYGYFAWKAEGEWNIKSKWPYSDFPQNNEPSIIIADIFIPADKPGNFMFGFVGSAGKFPYSHLSGGARGVQYIKDLWNNIISTRDLAKTLKKIEEFHIPWEAEDQQYIRAGFDLYKTYGLSINANALNKFLSKIK